MMRSPRDTSTSSDRLIFITSVTGIETDMNKTALLPSGSGDNDNIDAMMDSAKEATDFLKALAHEGRLMILCRLVEGECSVAEFEAMLSARQAAVSQQLTRLRLEGLVKTRRDGKTMYYSIADERVSAMVGHIYKMFCGDIGKNS